jgi:hypothetical protein
MERRQIVSGGLAAGFATVLGATPGTAQTQDSGDDRTAAAITELRQAIERSVAVSPELAPIREQQRAFLKANHKFPDFIEVGIGVWERVYDWHIRHQRPIEVSQTAEGPYTMTVIGTTLVLRPEQNDGFVGFGYDVR